MKKVIIFCAFTASALLFHPLKAQDDLLLLLENGQEKEKNEKVTATFKTTKVISAQTIETVKKRTLDFRITHRFGNIGTKSNGGAHTLWGFDTSEDIRFSFDYGITDRLQVGVGRSKMKEHLDGSVKYRILEQTKSNSMPISMALYSLMAYTPVKDVDDYYKKTEYRLSYTFQAIIARKFGKRFSFEVLPTLVHRNYVTAFVNAANGAEETNDIFALGVGGRLKLTRRTVLIADYFYNFSDFRINNVDMAHYNPLAIGIEIETGGHVFHMNLTNASGIIENHFIPNTRDTWTKGGYKMGFNISRVFNI